MTAPGLAPGLRGRPDALSSRVARGSLRVAGLGLATVDTARRLRSLRSSERDAVHERARVLREASRRVLDLHGVELDFQGALPIGGAVVAANHVSWLDPLVVASVLPCVPISKADLSGWPVIGGLARELGVVFISRGDVGSGARVLRAASAAVAHGLPVLNFPEGTTTFGGSVLPFRKGLFGVARTAGVPVFPAAITYESPELAWVGDAPFVPHYLKLAGRGRTRAFLRIGVPLAPGAYASAAELAAAARAAVAAMLEDLS